VFQKLQFSGDTGRNFENKLQQGKVGNFVNRDLGNMQHRPKALADCSIHVLREGDNCG